MINLDMSSKYTPVRLTEQAFDIETGVLVLNISLGAYDLTGKTVTAIFSPSGVETAALSVVEGLLQLPIDPTLIVAGRNEIQLNIYEGAEHEVSPIMVWRVGAALVGSTPASEYVDLLASLIAQSNAMAEDEALRVTAENDRETAVGLMAEAEIAREEADAARQEAAADMAIEEAGRVTAESGRVTA